VGFLLKPETQGKLCCGLKIAGKGGHWDNGEKKGLNHPAVCQKSPGKLEMKEKKS